ncbi:MAG TPA: universal stress protein [Burkholderiales bacterium]|nr:universal stress protein [Burkholderiales bacterium]
MFKHILIPTDGSPLSEKAIAAGIALAKESGARITGYHVLEAVPARLYAYPYRGEEEAIAEFEERRQEAARKHIAELARNARKQGVAFEPVVQTARTPYEGIVKAAQERDCDLILMSSHGRRGLARLAVGSVTDKVIQMSKVPVLVYR